MFACFMFDRELSGHAYDDFCFSSIKFNRKDVGEKIQISIY
ncbi:putative wbuO [Escherichia coli 2735000]|nr:putative wbuO [Escherichia coli 2735000]